jgi:hypothetical protein
VIKVDEKMGIGQRWHVVKRMEEMGGTTPWKADESGQSCYIWPKTPKKTHTKKKKKRKERENNT